MLVITLTNPPDGSDGKESTCNLGELGSIPGLGQFPRGGHGNPLQYSCLETPHGQRRLAGYSPRGHKELNITEVSVTHADIKNKLLLFNKYSLQ